MAFCRNTLIFSIALLITSLGVMAPAQNAGKDAGKKIALLIGINEYLHPGFDKLSYAEKDAIELGKVLQSNNYEVETLLADKATLKAIKDKITALAERKEKIDVLLLAFAGHGVQYTGKNVHFCPYDGRLQENTADKNLLSFDWLNDKLNESYAQKKMILYDACRNDSDPTRSGPDPDTIKLGKQTVLLLSCARKQKALEDPQKKHGVFTYAVIEGLKGEAANKNGDINYNSLAEYVVQRVTELKPEQTPHLMANFTGKLVLVHRDLATTAKHFKSSIGMELVRIEPGTFQMGSPAGELQRLDNEQQHEVEITKPFYIGKYTVTQEEYEKVTGKTPSHFRPDGEGKAKVAGLDTTRFPVEKVSWNEAKEFCKTLTQKDRAAGKISDKMEYVLPTEAEWEYCCRAGTTTPFHFGETISTDQANYYGLEVYGNGKKGVFRERTMSVGSFQANAWGLYDMHGNVYQWCEDCYDIDYYKNSPKNSPRKDPLCTNGQVRVLRGGSWDGYPRLCRCAYRYYYSPDSRSSNVGFRVVLRLSARTD